MQKYKLSQGTRLSAHQLLYIWVYTMPLTSIDTRISLKSLNPIKQHGRLPLFSSPVHLVGRRPASHHVHGDFPSLGQHLTNMSLMTKLATSSNPIGLAKQDASHTSMSTTARLTWPRVDWTSKQPPGQWSPSASGQHQTFHRLLAAVIWPTTP